LCPRDDRWVKSANRIKVVRKMAHKPKLKAAKKNRGKTKSSKRNIVKIITAKT
jgi:hypothetical protein